MPNKGRGTGNIRSSKFDIQRSTFQSLSNADNIRKVIEVDQSPIGKTLRSTPATYIGAFDIIRDIYAQLPEANMRGYNKSTFSFNTKGGRCETCKGAGRVKLEMNFMPDTHVTCEDCNGRRYNYAELEDLHWNGKSIADVLQMSFEDAAEFFSFHTQLSGLMQLMVETGLGYITLGQYSPTLSGGEAQRMKLVSELLEGNPPLRDANTTKAKPTSISSKILSASTFPTSNASPNSSTASSTEATQSSSSNTTSTLSPMRILWSEIGPRRRRSGEGNFSTKEASKKSARQKAYAKFLWDHPQTLTIQFLAKKNKNSASARIETSKF